MPGSRTSSHSSAVAALVASAATALGGTAAAWTPPPEPEPVPLRLDDSPALPLLEPFRHASGRPQSHLRRYLDGRYSRWLDRTWQILRWCPDDVRRPVQGGSLRSAHCPLASPLLAPVQPPAARDAAWRSWLADRPEGWPFVAADQHWFQPRPVDLVEAVRPGAGAVAFTISEELLPPWLQRLDAGWTGSLVAGVGCGRGGPCSPDAAFPAVAFEPLWRALSPKQWPIPAWQCRPREVTLRAHGREAMTFQLMSCDGSVPAGALDRLSILARPQGVPRPGDLLPDEADPSASGGEWLPGIRIMHPRLLWVLQRIADEWPWRAMYIYSGYRPAPTPPPPGTRSSYHWQGRALDLAVQGVPNEELFQLCRDLPDLGCGFYPNKPFVHVDVRPRGFGTAIWVDAAPPGEPAQYRRSWPGVVEEGAIGWVPP